MKLISKVISYIGTIVFAIFAWLQHEDNNPEIYTNPSIVDVWLWIGFYSSVSVSFLLACFDKFPKWLYFLVVIMAIYFMAFSVQGLMKNLNSGEFNMTKEAMNPKRPHIEITREFFGALIALLAVGYLHRISRRNCYRLAVSDKYNGG